MAMANDAFALAVLALAAYRASAMLARERGPANAFSRWREFVQRTFKPTRRTLDNGQEIEEEHWIAEGFTCVMCLSFWMGASGFVYGLASGRVLFGLAAWLAVAGMARILHKLVG